ncbi:hypothetical protein D9M72_599260 [compost metagenome]
MNRLAPDDRGGGIFDIAEPEVRIEPHILGLCPELAQVPGPGIVGREGKQQLISRGHGRVVDVGIDEEVQILRPSFDIQILVLVDAVDVDRLVRCGRRQELHDAHSTAMAAPGLIEP